MTSTAPNDGGAVRSGRRRRALRARLAPPRDRRRTLAAAALCGAISALGQAPFDLWPVALLSLAGLAWLHARAVSLREAAWIGWFGGVFYFMAALNWIVEPFLVDVARHGWMAPFALTLLSAGLALFWAVAFAAAQRIAPRGIWRLPVWIAALTLAELARGVVLTGFPWTLIGHVLIPSPMIHFAAWIGPDGLTALALALAAGIACIPRWPVRAGVPVVAALALALWAGPRIASDAPDPGADAPILRVLQPNAPQDQKWDPDMVGVFLDRLLAYSAEGPVPDAVIWPENSVPAPLHSAGGLLRAIGGQARGAVSAVGIQRREGARFYNSLAVVQQDGEVSDLYDKHHLVPFGEYMPFGDLFDRVGIRGLAARSGNGYSPGPGARLVDLGPAGRALPLICYEAVFPRDVAAAPERPDFLMQVTNDAWFGTFSGPYQHLAQARLRAVEQGLPLVRAANTGVSAVIAADGRVVASLPLGTAGWVDVPRPPAAAPTLYARVGGWPVQILIAVVLGGALLAGMSGSRARRRAVSR